MSTPPRPGASASDARRQLDELDALLQRMLALPVNPDEEFVRDAPPPGGGPDQPDSPWPANTYPAAYMVVQTSGPQDLMAPEPDPTPAPPDLGPDVLPDVHEEGDQAAEFLEPPSPDIAPPAPADEGAWVPFRSSWEPSPLTWQPLAESWQQSRASAPPAPPASASPEPVFGPSPGPGPIPEPPAEPVPPDPVPPAPGPSAPPPARWLLPLVWLNRGFDACLSPWGPPGRWLCGPAGKTFLGALGLLSLAGAAALLVAEGFGWTR